MTHNKQERQQQQKRQRQQQIVLGLLALCYCGLKLRRVPAWIEMLHGNNSMSSSSCNSMRCQDLKLRRGPALWSPGVATGHENSSST
jgi:hypothetical protein